MSRLYFAFPIFILFSLFFTPQYFLFIDQKEAPCKINKSNKPQVCIYTSGKNRIIKSNGIPTHTTGQFPNKNNPNRISPQQYSFSILLNPVQAKRITAVHGATPQPGQRPNAYRFGVAINGVPFDPGAGEFWINPETRRPNRSWQMEAMYAELGIDHNHAHVQPTGAYHYHGVPHALVADETINQHSSLIGYAADGFPVYYKYVYQNATDEHSGIVEMNSGYRIKKGFRAGNGVEEPDGPHDGTFVRDFEYVAGKSDLDECNGRYGITPEYPSGTYYYVLTDDYPYIPRCFTGTPSQDFKLTPPNRRPGQPQGMQGRRPPFRRN